MAVHGIRKFTGSPIKAFSQRKEIQSVNEINYCNCLNRKNWYKSEEQSLPSNGIYCESGCETDGWIAFRNF